MVYKSYFIENERCSGLEINKDVHYIDFSNGNRYKALYSYKENKNTVIVVFKKVQLKNKIR